MTYIMRYDVVVVGAGPAGSTAAKVLAEKKIKVLLLDKEKFPRLKPCGGGLPLKVLKRYPYLKKSKTIDSYSYGGKIYSQSLKYKIEILRKEPAISMVLRDKFDHELVKIAENEGAEFRAGVTVKNIVDSKDKITIFLKNGNEINTKLVIAADGYNSILARKMGLCSQDNWIGACIFEELKLELENIQCFFSDKHEFYVHLKYNNISGYGWVFPKSKSVNIGIGQFYKIGEKRSIKLNLREMYTSYLKFLKDKKIIPENLKSEKMHGGVVPICPIKKTYSDRFMVCGDAAGFANPISGEGIYYAITSGMMAAQTAINALECNDTSAKFLSQYEKMWIKDFGNHFKILKGKIDVWKVIGENIMEMISYDPYLGNQIFDVMVGQANLYDLRLKIIQRYLYVKMKYSILKHIKK